MSEWLYTLRRRMTAATNERFSDYQKFSGFSHVIELVTLDSLLCPSVVGDLRTEDWAHNVHEDFRTDLFRDADYLFGRQPLDANHQLIAAWEQPTGFHEIPTGFVVCGHDIMDSRLGNSALTNCGPVPEVFSPLLVNEFGLIDELKTATRIRDNMRQLKSDDPHLGVCEVWLLARKLPEAGQVAVCKPQTHQ